MSLETFAIGILSGISISVVSQLIIMGIKSKSNGNSLLINKINSIERRLERIENILFKRGA